MELSGKSTPALYSRLPLLATPSTTLRFPDGTLVVVEADILGAPLPDGTIPVVTDGWSRCSLLVAQVGCWGFEDSPYQLQSVFRSFTL